jgi:hypothetical protein
MSAGIWVGIAVALLAGVVAVLIAAGLFRRR